MEKISRKKFEQRLRDLILSGPDAGLPRRQEDRLILLFSVCLGLDRRRTYTEWELDIALAIWPSQVGGRTGIDSVTLRRALVDHGFVRRDPAGHEYRVHPDILQGRFEPTVLDVDPVECLEVEREARAMQKARHREREESDPPLG